MPRVHGLTEGSDSSLWRQWASLHWFVLVYIQSACITSICFYIYLIFWTLVDWAANNRSSVRNKKEEAEPLFLKTHNVLSSIRSNKIHVNIFLIYNNNNCGNNKVAAISQGSQNKVLRTVVWLNIMTFWFNFPPVHVLQLQPWVSASTNLLFNLVYHPKAPPLWIETIPRWTWGDGSVFCLCPCANVLPLQLAAASQAHQPSASGVIKCDAASGN